MAADWWRGAVIYQIYPRSFLDTSGDGVGDLNGITRRLDYVAGLGVDAVWISPFFTSPMLDFGYDVADFVSVDPLFGTLADFDRLVERAHALDLKVMIDQVVSHTASVHPWFRAAAPAATIPRPIGTCGPTPSPMVRRPQLAQRVRRNGLAVGCAAAAILPAQFPVRSAGPELSLRGDGHDAIVADGILAPPRRRRLSPGHRQFLYARRRAAR